MLEDYLAREPVATWNSARGVWEKQGMVNLFCEHWELFSEVWPTSGMMRNGQVFELPIQAHPITGSGSLLLRTPVADENGGGALSPEMARAKGQTLRLTGQIIDLVEPDRLPKPLFPTPNTMDHLPPRSAEKLAESRERSAGGYANVRETVVNDLLPTVTTQDGKNNGGPSQFERNTKPLNTQVLVDTEWGKFEPAIRRWEAVTGRKAPAPTKPDGKDGQHRLSSEFTEWMMGLDAGWVTGVGLSRNDELKACGNGVVPQQALLALSVLFDGFELDREREL